MPYKPQFGGSNGVPEIDLGQEGSPRGTGGTPSARYNPNVIVGPVQTRDVDNPLTQQSVKFVDLIGPTSQRITWRGQLLVDDDATLGAIESDLHEYKTGMALLNGVRQAFDGTRIAATMVTNKAGRTIAAKTRLADYRFGRLRTITTPGSEFTLMTELTVTFEVLG